LFLTCGEVYVGWVGVALGRGRVERVVLHPRHGLHDAHPLLLNLRVHSPPALPLFIYL
jgi:hypothetical protein